jgi:YbgC/YbaW family acyl-CoA thioester hydrolase
MSRTSEYTLRRRVLFYELDSAGIVHFSNYFRYMEEAEHALWRHAGLSVAPANAEFGFPRVAVGIEYYKPLRFEDEFDIRVRIVALSARKIQYSCRLTRGDEKIATGSVTVVCVSLRPNEPMRAIPIPADIAAKLEAAADADS